MIVSFQRIGRVLAAIAFASLLVAQGLAASETLSLGSGFADFPVSKIHRGPARQPDFRGRDREYSQYRTRIRRGLKAGPTLAGKYAVIQFGCGTGGCNVYFAVDLTTGKVISLPGGEEYAYLVLDYQKNSRLLEARWVKDGRCLLQKFVIDGGQLDRSEIKDTGPADTCPAKPASYPFSF